MVVVVVVAAAAVDCDGETSSSSMLVPSPSRQQNTQSTIPPNVASFFNGLDASSSKQLAALSAAGNARRAQSQAVSGGTSANFIGGIALRPDSSFAHAQGNQPPHTASPFNMSPHRQQHPISPQQAAAIHKNRQQNFLQGLSKVMASRNIPLPSSITGVESSYDPASSPWKNLEPASEVGGIKLAGKDVDLYKLWGIVFTAGGAGKVQQQNAWPGILPHFGLPEQLPHPRENGNTSTANALAQLYMMLLGAFDDFYYRGMTDAQRQALTQQGRLPLPASAGTASFHGHSMSPPGVAQAQPLASSDLSTQSFSAGSSDLDADSEGRKRKMDDVEDANSKRSRRKTDPESPVATHGASEMPASSTSAGRVKARRRIEYYPLAREVDTAGGRNVDHIQNELLRLSRGHPLRDINEWGRVYVDALTMSIRSRISTELSYGLTTLIILSTMRSAAFDTGFLIGQCEELLDEVLDLLEELSFPNDSHIDPHTDDAQIVTSRQLLNFAHEEISEPFASEGKKQGDYDPTVEGPVQRGADLIRLILNILRNLSAVTDNQAFMAQHPVLVDLLLRITCLRTSEGESPRAASVALSLPDLIAVRKDVLSTFVNLAGAIALFPSSQSSLPPAAFEQRAQRMFELVSSYLADPADAVSPFAWILQSGIPFTPHVRAPLLPDAALEVFTRISQPDANRKVISRTLPAQWLWRLFEALVHRLPATDHDYKLVVREESWMSYLEKLILSLYSLAFLMPPELKKRVKEDCSLSFAKIMLRFVKRVMSGGPAQSELRIHFLYCARRSIETMKVIDDGEDSFDTSQLSMPTLSFGVGYGEVGDKRVEKGIGLLGGYRDDVLWSVMLQRELDDVMFTELESLARTENELDAN